MHPYKASIWALSELIGFWKLNFYGLYRSPVCLQGAFFCTPSEAIWWPVALFQLQFDSFALERGSCSIRWLVCHVAGCRTQADSQMHHIQWWRACWGPLQTCSGSLLLGLLSFHQRLVGKQNPNSKGPVQWAWWEEQGHVYVLTTWICKSWYFPISFWLAHG